jgi:hypothetical protein
VFVSTRTGVPALLQVCQSDTVHGHLSGHREMVVENVNGFGV